MSHRHRRAGGTPLRSGSSGVAVFLFRRAPDLEVLLMERAGGGMVGEWCPVAGRCEPGEQPRRTAVREVREETGLALPRLGPCEAEWSARERGRGLRIFVFSALVEAHAEVTLNYEHTAYAWCETDRALGLLPLVQQRRALSSLLPRYLQ